jgi:hypothetical protein
MKKIIITGCPRTGTTALTALLFHSANAVITNELGLFHPQKIVFEEKINKPLDTQNSRLIELKKWNKQELEYFINDQNNYPNIELFGDKLPDYCLTRYIMFYLTNTYPDAYFIFTHRNPCAVVHSFLKRTAIEKNEQAAWYVKTTEEALDRIIRYNINWSTFFFPRVKNKIIIDYDDYINNPSSLIDKLNQFLDTKLDIYKPEKLYLHDNPNEFEKKLSDWEQDMINTKYSIILEHINKLKTESIDRSKMLKS